MNEGGAETRVLSLSYGSIVERDVESNYGLLPASFDGYNIVEPNDIVMRLTDMQNDQRSLRTGPVTTRGIITSAYVTVTPGSALLPRFAHYLLHGYDLAKVFYRMGGGLRQSMKYADLKRLPVVLPPKDAQARIARFLDEQTERIDALMAEKETLLERVKELWVASVADTMAGGDAGNRHPTHYACYPTIPAGWRVLPFKHAVQFVEGPGILADDFRDEGVPLLRVSCVRESVASLDGCNYLDPEKVAKKWSHFRVKEGDLLISASASMGTVSLVTAETAGAVPYTGIIILRPLPGVAVRSFVEHFVVSDQFLRQIDSFKAGATIQHFGPTHLKQMVLALPHDPQEQQRIADRLTEMRTEHAKLEAHVREHIERLREYRASLISAAVTGQLDISASAEPARLAA